MADTISTRDFPARWAEDVREANQLEGTQVFLFRHEIGHLLVCESVTEQAGSEPELQGIGERSSTGERTWHVQPACLRVPRARRVSTRFEERYILLKKYEGFVTACDDHSFTARLTENRSDYPVLEAEFDLEELSETDRELAVEGAAMVWTIGYRYDGSTRKRESAIYLRRLPSWSDKEIEQAKHEARELTRGINWV